MLKRFCLPKTSAWPALLVGLALAACSDDSDDSDGENDPDESGGEKSAAGADENRNDECALTDCSISGGAFAFSYSCGTQSSSQSMDYAYDDNGLQIGVVAVTMFTNGRSVTCERHRVEPGVFTNGCRDDDGAECSW